MNRITLIGNVSKDPELRVTPNGKTVCNFNLAVQKSRSKDAQFFRIVTFGTQAESCNRNLSKGKKVCVTGELILNSYDAKDGTKRYSLDVTANDVEFLSPKDLPKSDVNGNNVPNLNDYQSIGDDDIPF